jgi:hypothetical protein
MQRGRRCWDTNKPNRWSGRAGGGDLVEHRHEKSLGRIETGHVTRPLRGSTSPVPFSSPSKPANGRWRHRLGADWDSRRMRLHLGRGHWLLADAVAQRGSYQPELEMQRQGPWAQGGAKMRRVVRHAHLDECRRLARGREGE